MFANYHYNPGLRASVILLGRPAFCNGLFTETILICLKCLQIIIKSCQALWNAGTYVRAQVLFLYFCVVLLTNVRDGFQETTLQCFQSKLLMRKALAFVYSPTTMQEDPVKRQIMIIQRTLGERTLAHKGTETANPLLM